MSRKNRHRPAPALQQTPMARESAGAKRFTADSFQNFEARVGIGTNNQSSASSYGFDFISRNRVQMEAMYRSSWIVGAVVDSVAEDMTRAGISVTSDLTPDDQQEIDQAIERMQIWDALCDTVKWSRLYGGALAVMLIDGQKMDTPLNVDSVGEGQFKGLLVLDRWLVQPSLENLVTDLGPDLGKPKFYDVVADSMALKRQRIHYSRVLRIDGVDLPYWQKISENLWGQSVIERLFDRLLAFDSTTQGAAQLVYKAHLRTLKVDKLREIIGLGGPALDGLVKQIDMIRRYQSNEGLTLLDASDEFQVDQYTFAGLDDVMLQMAQQLSGASEIPLTRLFGQSPAGLSSTGDGEMKQYHESVNTKQERRLRMPLTCLIEVVARSVLGVAMPKGWSFTFNSLQRMSDTEKSAVATATTTAVLDAAEAGVIDQATALKELKQASELTGLFTNITHEMITEAENAPPPISEEDPSLTADAFIESEHPRDDDGKFGSGNGSGSSSGNEKAQSVTGLVTVTGFNGAPSVPVRVQASADAREMKLHVDEGGNAVLTIPEVFMRDKEFVRYRAFRAVEDFLWPYADDVYIRAHDKPEDFDFLKNGQHKGSKNHATGEEEGGLSVAKDIEAGYSHAYLVSGKKIGQGSDSEPLLDTSTVKVISKRMPSSALRKKIKAATEEKMSKLGIGQEEIKALRSAFVLKF